MADVVHSSADDRKDNVAEAPPDRLLALSQRAGRLWSWQIDLDRMEWRSTRPIALFRKGEPSRGPYKVVRVVGLFGHRQGAELLGLIDRLKLTGEGFSYEVRDNSGPTARYFAVDAEPDLDASGRVAGIFGVTRDVTDLRQTGRRLARQTRLLERAQRLGRLGHWEIDAGTGALSWSDSLFGIFGMDPGDGISVARFLDMVVPSDRERVAGLRADAISRLERFDYITGINLADGRQVVIETSGEPDYGADCEYRGYFGTTQDITARVAAERSSRENEIRLQTIFDAMDRAGIGIGVQDNDGYVEVARPALLRIAGLNQDSEIIGKRWSSLQGEGGADIRNTFGDALKRAAEGHMDAVPNMELEWVRPDGQRLSVLVRLAPLPGGSRAMIVLDQTAQKVARREIEAREHRTRAILEAIDAAGVGYCVEDTDGRIFDVSPALRKMLGIDSGEDLLGRKLTETLPLPDGMVRRIQLDDEAFREDDGTAFVYPEFVLSLPGRGDMRLHVRSTPLPGIGRLVLVIDQTERWRLEQQQAEMERHMQHVQKMEAVGQLAGGVAHEINNMLHPIRTFTRAAASSDDPERQQHLLERVIDCADKAAQIVRETLHFARGDHKAATDHDLNALLSGVVGFSRDLPMRGIELEIALPAETVWATVNETEFTQVIVNLLQNAADAMSEAGTIMVELGSLEVGMGGSGSLPAGRYAQITVADTGEGLPPELIDRVFEPFFTTKDPGKGTGLGLSVVYGIVKRWKGDIRIVSEPGRGTRVSVILPRTAGTAPAETGIS